MTNSTQQSLNARKAAHLSHVFHDPIERTAKARAASPASVDYWAHKVATEFPELPEAEVNRRASHLHRAHMADLSRRGVEARQATAARKRAAREKEREKLRTRMEAQRSAWMRDELTNIPA